MYHVTVGYAVPMGVPQLHACRCSTQPLQTDWAYWIWKHMWWHKGNKKQVWVMCQHLHIIINNKMGSTEPLSGISDIYGHSGSVNLYMQSISQITFLNLYKKVFSFKLIVSNLLITILYFKCVLRNVASGIQHFFHIYWLSLTCLICRTNGCQLKISLDFVLSLWIYE